MLIEVFPSGPIDTNALLIGCEKTHKAAIIDAPLESVQNLKKFTDKRGLSVEMLLLTHSHWDHIADIAEMKRVFQAPVYVHEEDAQNVESPGTDGLPLYFPIEGVKPDRLLADGEILELGTLSIRVIHTPGHTPGGVCFYLEKEGVLIAGDTLFCGGVGKISLPTGRPQLMRASLRKLALLPPATVVYPGHGPTTTIEAERVISLRL